jgi:manganese transport protein
MSQDRTTTAKTPSLLDVHSTVPTSHVGFWRRMLAFGGPAYLVSVGYMDPGNWATDIGGGAHFGYQLLWVLVMANVMALLLQTLSARLGIVTGRDLAQACRDEYPIGISHALWILCELAIVACDLAEVLGAAIGLQLLFHIPLLIGVMLTAADTLLILWLTRYGIRTIEAFVIVLIFTISGCFLFEIFLAKPAPAEVLRGLVPRLSTESLYLAVSILGATVMPHNLYLHSALVQTRHIGKTIKEKRTACRFNFLDSMIALNAALLVNAAILIVSAAVFFKHGIIVEEIQQAHALLSPLLGTALASVVFGAALLASGQSSTLTGTMAGQIVMEGFLRFKMQPWLRRLVTRFMAIVPAALTIYYAGEKGTYGLLILSQVILSLQLPFAVIPLINFTSDRKRMGVFTNNRTVWASAWLAATIILALNIWLAWTLITPWINQSGAYQPIVIAALALALGGLAYILVVIVFWPMFRRRAEHAVRVALAVNATQPALKAPPRYSTILVSLDHSDADAEALANAMTLALSHDAEVILLHVEEGVASQVYGSLASTAEITEGQDYFEEIAESLRRQGIRAQIRVQYGSSPAREIARVANQVKPDLLIMGSHGHKGLKDLIFGTTINNVRHHVSVPILIVRGNEGRTGAR